MSDPAVACVFHAVVTTCAEVSAGNAQALAGPQCRTCDVQDNTGRI